MDCIALLDTGQCCKEQTENFKQPNGVDILTLPMQNCFVPTPHDKGGGRTTPCYLLNPLLQKLKILQAIGLGEELLDFWNGAANVFIWGLQFGGGEIIWDLKFPGSKCAICGLKFGSGKIIWDRIFLVSCCPSHFLGMPSSWYSFF